MTAIIPTDVLRSQLYEELIYESMLISGNPELTKIQVALATAHKVLDVIDGGKGNRPDGVGLPLLQFMVSPHPEFTAAQEKHTGAIYDTSVPLNHGLAGNDYSTGIAADFANHYEKKFASQIQDRSFKAAKDLFGSPE